MDQPISYRPISTKTLTEAMINNYKADGRKVVRENELQKINDKRRYEHIEKILEVTEQKKNLANRRESFISNVKTALFSEALYKVYSEAVREDLANSTISRSIMRGLVSNFVNENDISSILRRMRTGSMYLSEVYQAIDSASREIIEANLDNTNPDSFVIDVEKKDDFLEKLDQTDSGEMSEEIANRVADAVTDFVETNKKEHEAIKDIIEDATNENVTPDDNSDDNDTDSKSNDTNSTEPPESKPGDAPAAGPSNESASAALERLTKNRINMVRNGKKNVFHNLVSAMAEQVIRNKDMQKEYMTEGKLDMSKIVGRVELMYTFMETVNTIKLVNVDEQYLLETLQELRQ